MLITRRAQYISIFFSRLLVCRTRAEGWRVGEGAEVNGRKRECVRVCFSRSSVKDDERSTWWIAFVCFFPQTSFSPFSFFCNSVFLSILSIFHMGFRLQVVFARIYYADRMCNTAQPGTWKLFGSVSLTCLNSLGQRWECLWSDAQVILHFTPPAPGTDKHCSFSHFFKPNNSQFCDIMCFYWPLPWFCLQFHDCRNHRNWLQNEKSPLLLLTLTLTCYLKWSTPPKHQKCGVVSRYLRLEQLSKKNKIKSTATEHGVKMHNSSQYPPGEP